MPCFEAQWRLRAALFWTSNSSCVLTLLCARKTWLVCSQKASVAANPLAIPRDASPGSRRVYTSAHPRFLASRPLYWPFSYLFRSDRHRKRRQFGRRQAPESDLDDRPDHVALLVLVRSRALPLSFRARYLACPSRMPIILALLLSPLSLVSAAPTTPIDQVGRDNGDSFGVKNVQLGDRPYYLINNMTEGPLKTKLESCRENDFKPTRFSISHRGAPLQYPEHTIEGLVVRAFAHPPASLPTQYNCLLCSQAAHRQGSGVIECDISFTSDRQLVCRRALPLPCTQRRLFITGADSNCDLQQTTDILLHPELAAKCTEPFTPATDNGTAASAKCCVRPPYFPFCAHDQRYSRHQTSLSPSSRRSAANKTASTPPRPMSKISKMAHPLGGQPCTTPAVHS